MTMPLQNGYERIYNFVREIPAGQVATYGQIASLLKLSTPRQVGNALGGLIGSIFK